MNPYEKEADIEFRGEYYVTASRFIGMRKQLEAENVAQKQEASFWRQKADKYRSENAQLQKQVAFLSATLVVKDEALEVAKKVLGDGYREYAAEALALQPHASILNKIRAEVVREAFEGKDLLTYADAMDLAQRIEKGEA